MTTKTLTNNYFRGILSAIAFTLAAMPFCPVSATDLTVVQGDAQTISVDATYDAVIVNGELTVAPNVTLTCTRLTVADGISGTATLTVGDGGSVAVTGSGETKIGVGTGRAEVFLGANVKFTAAGYFNFCYGHDEELTTYSDFKTQALLVVGTNSIVECESDFCFGYEGVKSKSQSAGNAVRAEVRLDKDAVIVAKRINHRNPYAGKIVFNGGKIAKKANDSYSGGFVNLPTSWKSMNALVLEGTNGFPITFHLPDRGSYNSFASFGSTTRRLVMQGDGGFLKTGAGIFPLVNSTSNWGKEDANLRFLFTGDFEIAEGGFSVATSPTNNVFRSEISNQSRPVDLVVKNGASFDLAGCSIVVNSITADGSGVVTNSYPASAQVSLGVLNDGRGSTLARTFPGISIVKKGGATLSLCGTDIDSVDVQGGTLVLKDRNATGYPFYRFQIDAIRKDVSNSSVKVIIKDVAFRSNGVDVTRPYTALYHDASGTSTTVSPPENLFDGNLETAYEDYRATAGTEEKRAKVGVTVEYSNCLAVDSYRWAPYRSSSSDNDPTVWRVFGGFSATDLTSLDRVTGFSVSDVVDGWNSTNFVFTSVESSATHIRTLTLANGVSITIDGAQTSCDTFNVGSSCSLNVIGDKSVLKGELIQASSCANPGNICSWSTSLNGAQIDRKLCFENGAVRLRPRGFIVDFK